MPLPASVAFGIAGVCLVALGCARELEVSPPPYKPVATVRELMESVVAHAAETYWGSVQVIVDETGVHERVPQTDEEWEAVWAAGLSIAESGNLLMMAPRAVASRRRRRGSCRRRGTRRRARVRGRRAGLQRLHGLSHALPRAVERLSAPRVRCRRFSSGRQSR